MQRLLSLALLLPLAAGCGTSATTGDGGAGNNDASAGTEADLFIPNTTTMPLTIGPIPLAAGQERTVCSTFKLPNAAAIDVVQIAASLAPGSHHLILYKSKATREMKDIYDCPALDISSGDVPMYIAETEANNTLPMPTGVAYHIEAGQMVRLEAHYLNASPQAVMGMGTVNLTVAAPASGTTYQPADIMFCGSVVPLLKPPYGTGVAPGKTDLPAAFWKPPAGIKLFGLTTHEHKRGTLMTVDKAVSLDDTAATNLTMGTPYDNPPFKVWGDSAVIPFDGTNGLRWQCHYQNNDQTTYYFGQSAQDNEMCFFWGYYYPSVGHFIQGDPQVQPSSPNCWQ